jgi:hypothetical protein
MSDQYLTQTELNTVARLMQFLNQSHMHPDKSGLAFDIQIIDAAGEEAGQLAYTSETESGGYVLNFPAPRITLTTSPVTIT